MLLDFRAKFEAGLYKGREGSMSYSIVDNKKETLIEGIYCISLQYEHFNTETLMDLETQDKYSLEMIKKALEPWGLFDDFSACMYIRFLDREYRQTSEQLGIDKKR